MHLGPRVDVVFNPPVIDHEIHLRLLRRRPGYPHGAGLLPLRADGQVGYLSHLFGFQQRGPAGAGRRRSPRRCADPVRPLAPYLPVARRIPAHSDGDEVVGHAAVQPVNYAVRTIERRHLRPAVAAGGGIIRPDIDHDMGLGVFRRRPAHLHGAVGHPLAAGRQAGYWPHRRRRSVVLRRRRRRPQCQDDGQQQRQGQRPGNPFPRFHQLLTPG